MLPQIVILALFLCILLISVNAQNETKGKNSYRITCPPGRTRTYSYKSRVDAFGDEKNAEKIKFDGVFRVQCLQSQHKKNGKDLFNIALVIDKLKISMKKKDKTEGWESKNEKVKRHFKLLKKDGDVTGYFKKPIHASYTSNGKVVHVFHAEDEEDWVTAIKKTIFAKFQTKLTGSHRKEHDEFGDHESHYRKTKDTKRGLVRVVKSYSDRDMPRHRYEPGHKRLMMDKQMKMDTETESILNAKTGQIESVISHGSYDLGAQRERKHKGFFHDNQNVPYEKTEKKLTSENAFKLSQTTVLSLVSEEMVDLPNREDWKLKILSDDDLSYDVADGYVQGNLSHTIPNEPHGPEGTRMVGSVNLKDTRNYNQMLQDLAENPDDHSTYLKLASLVNTVKDRRFIVALDRAYSNGIVRYLKDRTPKNLTFVNAMRSLILGTKEGASAFNRGLRVKDDEFLNAHILSGLNKGKRWFNKKNVLRMKRIIKSHKNKDVRRNAYLVLADSLSHQSKKSKLAKKLAKWIVKRMVSSEDPLLDIHAVGNAGDHIPLAFLESIIRHRHIAPVARKAAIDALRRRSDGQELLHDLLTDHHTFSLEDMESAIQALEERHPKHDPHSLEKVAEYIFKQQRLPFKVKHRLALLLHKRQEQLDRPMKKLVKCFERQRRRHVLKKQSKEELADTMALTMRRRRFRRYRPAYRHVYRRPIYRPVVRPIYRPVVRPVYRRPIYRPVVRPAVRPIRYRHVRPPKPSLPRGPTTGIVRRVIDTGKKVVNAGKNIVKGLTGAKWVKQVKDWKKNISNLFAKATFKNKKACRPASNKRGDLICLYDAKLASFVASQGSFSDFTGAKHFEWERLIGADKIHLYLGLTTYLGTNLDCENPNDEFRFAVYAKGLSRLVAFTKEIEIFDAHAFVRQNPSLENRGYLKVMGASIYNSPLFNANTCQDFNKRLMNKRFDNLPGFSFIVMIGPVPVEFGFTMTAGFSLDIHAGFCLRDLSAQAGITPGINAGVRAHAKISVVVLKAGVEVEGIFNYGLTPGAQLKGTSCKLCMNVKSKQSLTFNINVAADINVVVLNKTWRKTLLSLTTPPKHVTLFERCYAINRLFKDQTLNALVTGNQRFSE